jgi:hypothetical protein
MRPYETRGHPIHIDEGRKTTIEFTAITAQYCDRAKRRNMDGARS